MESGWPLLIGLEGVNLKNGQQVDHVLTVLGHTLDPFRWSPEARHGYGMLPRSSFLSAVEWTDHFVINDDGYGMHMTLQSDVIRNFIAPHRNASLHVMFVMDIRPSYVKFDGLNATMLSTDLLRNFCKQIQGKIEGKWLARLTQSRELVCRTLHVSRDEYIGCLLPAAGALAAAVNEKLLGLPESFWVTEFALPPLYTANGRKLADVVMRSDEGTANRSASDIYSKQWELIWLPGAVQFRGHAPSSWPITGPIEMMRSGGSLLIH
jgi:hypothetical protein